MAQLGNLLVKGSSRFLNKAYFEDISIAGTSFFSGNISTDGTLNIGANKASNALLYLNNKIAVRAVDSWLRINDTSTNFTSGVYFGNSDVRTDKEFQVGDGGKYFKINSSSLNVNVSSVFSQRTTHNGGLISPTISSNLISFVKNGNTLPKIDGADVTAVLNELTVLSTLRAKEYELDHVQNLGGTFMVSPSFICTEGSTSVTVSAISGSEVTFLIKDNATLTKTEIATASWVLNSQIKLSGKIGNTILANATGTITKSVDTNNHTITVKVDVGSSTVGNFTVNTTYSGSQVSKLALMMIRNASGYRLGIYLESYSSENKKPVINIFDGSDTNPKVVLGKLDGTPKINNISPTGYGLYSDNAFLKGTIIATSGTIGGFTLSTNSIQNGTFGQDGSVMMSLGSNNSASIGDSGNINGWTFTAGSKFGVTKNGAMYATSGKIGGFNIDSTYLQSSDKTVGLSASASDWAFWAGGAGTDTAKFRVNHAGKLWASNATIAGNITATSGKIGKYTIDDYLITGSGSTCTGMGGNQAFWAGSNNSNNAPFHVSYDGSLYASKANISGTINSTDGSIGGWKISSGSFSSGKTYQGETYDIYLNSSGKIIASNENKYNNNKIIFGIFPEIYGRSVYDAGIQILNKEGNNSLLMHDQIVFSHMDNMSNPFQKTAQMTKYDYEGIKFGWAWNVKNGNDWSETTIKSQIYWNEDDSTINFSGADISLNDGKWLYLQKGCIALKNNAYIYTTTKENNLISLIGYSVSNTLWVGDYNNFTGGNCIITANNVYKNASGSWTSLSDARYKHDFKEISHATDFILGLNPCLYKFNDGTSDRYHMGFKAQEVEKNMLSTIGDTGLTVKYNCTEGLDVDLNNPETYMLGLRYDELIAPLIQVVQEQQYKIQELEKKVTALSN